MMRTLLFISFLFSTASLAYAQDSTQVEPQPDYTICAPFLEDGPAEDRTPPISRPPRLLNMSQAAGMVDEATLSLRRRGLSGKAILWYLVDATGRLREVRLAQSSGVEPVDSTALAVASRFRFEAATYNGRKVCVWFAQPLRFR